MYTTESPSKYMIKYLRGARISIGGIFSVSGGFGQVFNFPRLFEEHCWKNSCITYSKDYKHKKLCNTQKL